MKIESIVTELERVRLASGGKLYPQKVVDAARPSDSPLHSQFTWDDGEAAEKYRLVEAQKLIRVVVTVLKEDRPPVRMYVSIERDRKEDHCYRHIVDVTSNADDLASMLETALSELRAFRRKYQALSELAPLFAAVDEIERTSAR